MDRYCYFNYFSIYYKSKFLKLITNINKYTFFNASFRTNYSGF